VVPVRKPLVPDLHLGEVEAACLGVRAAAGHGTDGQAVPEERAVDLPRSQARAQTPDVLKVFSRGQCYRIKKNFRRNCGEKNGTKFFSNRRFLNYKFPN
jgi:hypothetical protein